MVGFVNKLTEILRTEDCGEFFYTVPITTLTTYGAYRLAEVIRPETLNTGEAYNALPAVAFAGVGLLLGLIVSHTMTICHFQHYVADAIDNLRRNSDGSDPNSSSGLEDSLK